MNEEFKKKVNSYIGQKVTNKTALKKVERLVNNPDKILEYMNETTEKIKELQEDYEWYESRYRVDESIIENHRGKEREYKRYIKECDDMLYQLKSVLITIEREKNNDEYEKTIKEIDELRERGRNI